MRRIVRNRAAEKAKLSGYGTPSPLPQDPGTALGRHPAYSINGILGIHQPDANANLHKRKRDEEGDLPKIVALGVTKRCRLSWLTNCALVYEPKRGGRGEVAGSQTMSTAVPPKYTLEI